MASPLLAAVLSLFCLASSALAADGLISAPKQYMLDPSFKITNKPQVRKYTLVATKVDCAPDGYPRKCLVVNNSLPGPLIEANAEDTLEVKVINRMESDELTMHWHGLHMNGTNWDDGVYGMTQCGIRPGKSHTYKIHLNGQFGTFFYHAHSHDELQDGLSGPLIIHSPKDPIKRRSPNRKGEFDRELVVMLADWYHDTAATIMAALETPEGYNGRPVSAAPNSALISGIGQYDCAAPTDAGKCEPYHRMINYRIPRDTRVRLRLIHTGAHASFRYSIDEHKLRIVEADATPVKSHTVKRLTLSPGQRYSAIVSFAPEDTGKNFFVRAWMVKDCLASNLTYWNPVVTGVIRVPNKRGEVQKGLPTTHDWTGDAPIQGQCDDPDLTPRKEVDVPKKVVARHYLNATIFPNPLPGTGALVPGKVRKIYYNGISAENYPNDPLLHQLAKPKGKIENLHTEHITLDGPDWYDLVYVNPTVNPQRPHPIHLHSIDMHIVAQGDNTTYPSPQLLDSLDYKTKNPMRRDTVHVPAGGWMVVRVRSDVPGVLYGHCHVSFHLGVGMGFVLVSQPDKIRRFKIPKANLELCAAGGQDVDVKPAGRYARRSIDLLTSEEHPFALA